ncbi:serine/threonine protein phosphatase [Trypanosoma cruzi]|nr:serine/threonine protein phosphatase [Trypanosoma cruzi]
MRHCGEPKCFVMRTVVTPRWGGPRIGRYAVHLPGVHFDHTHRAASLSDKFFRSVRAMPALNSLTIAEMEVVASRFLYAAAILGTRLFDHHFSIKAVRRRLSALDRGLCRRHPRRTFRRQRLVWARDCDKSSRI